MVARRSLLIAGAVGGGALLVPQRTSWAWARDSGPVGSFDPTTIPKYVTPLFVPPAMPALRGHHRGWIDRYAIAVRQFRQQILPAPLPATTVWGYGSVWHPGTFHTPAYTIEATVDRPVQVTWINGLADRSGRYRPHLLPVDPTLHWANPSGGLTGRDSRPTFTTTPESYRGPVPIVTHLHGGHSREESDGYPEAWYLPDAGDIPQHFARVGSFYDEFQSVFAHRYGRWWRPGTATSWYDNDQRATAEWYHDHTLGLTRLNVYAGLAGFYLLRGGSADLPAGVLPGPAPAPGDPPGRRYHEIPVIIQDRSFNADGSLFYPDSRAWFDCAGPYLPEGPFSPIWNPDFLGDTMMVNGRTWPVLDVEPCRYRFRLLNGCNARFLVLKIAADPTTRPVSPSLPLWQIGNDGGFLPAPERLDSLLMAPGERADVIVDFTGLPVGTELLLVNEGPDAPFSGWADSPADPATTGQVMKFRVGERIGPDRSVPPEWLQLPAITRLDSASVTRRLVLSEVHRGGSPAEMLLGTRDGEHPVRRYWHDPVTEAPALGATEVWELANFTGNVHPVHLHGTQFEVLGRGRDGRQPPEPGERGFKDVVVTYPGHRTRIKARFDLPGRYVWHCHLLEHEDNEMMRPYQVG